MLRSTSTSAGTAPPRTSRRARGRQRRVHGLPVLERALGRRHARVLRTREPLTASDTDTSFDLYVATSPGTRGPRPPARCRCRWCRRFAVRVAEPHARAAARLRIVQPAPTRRRRSSRWLPRRARRRGELHRLRALQGHGRRARPAGRLQCRPDPSLTDVRCRRAAAAAAAQRGRHRRLCRRSAGLRRAPDDRSLERGAAGGGTDAATVQEVTLAGSFPCGTDSLDIHRVELQPQYLGERARARAASRTPSGRSGSSSGCRCTTAALTSTPTRPPTTRCSPCRASSFRGHP